MNKPATNPRRHLATLGLPALMGMLLGGCAIYETHEHRHHNAPPIPKGHMPPPGECRIWYPDRPPGQQPPPGDCRKLRLHVPPGAYLIRG